jgi:TolB-like protein/DNA-binding winged helix-turn-helix (wHTH) protein/Tfp pilus assembly protein PilF
MYRFGEFSLDARRRTLLRDESPVFLTPKAFDVLFFLLQNPNRLVTKEELLRAIWGDIFVEEGNLTQYISHIRKALGDNSEDSRLIATIARKGYQFTGDVTVGEADVAKQSAAQIPITEGQITERGLRTPRHWRNAAVMGASAVILVVVGYMSWRHPWGVTPPRSEKIMLAVLPFENLTGDPNKEYLADGLTEETISQLGRLNPERMGVIGRTSVMGYKHKDERLDQIGRDLSVQYVLENSLRESGDHIRLTAQLIQVKDQSHLWSQDYDYRAQDILTVQDDVAKAVAQEIQVRLSPQQKAELARPHPVNPQAFDAYLQGYSYFQRDTDRDTDMAVRYYEQATQLDPNYALAWVGLSRARNWQAELGLIPMEEGRRLAYEAAERALALNPNLAEAHSQMARLKRFEDLDWVGADDSIQRAIALDPGNPDILNQAAFSAAQSGRSEQAFALARRAINLDPLNSGNWEILGEFEFYKGQFVEAERDVKKALELSPDLFPGPITLSRIYVMEGRPQDALLEIERVRAEGVRAFLYAVAYNSLGQKKKSDAALKELIEKYSGRDSYFIASVYAFRNQRDEAFKWLDRAYAQREGNVAFTNLAPELKNLHGDPRFVAFLKKIRLPN